MSFEICAIAGIASTLLLAWLLDFKAFDRKDAVTFFRNNRNWHYFNIIGHLGSLALLFFASGSLVSLTLFQKVYFSLTLVGLVLLIYKFRFKVLIFVPTVILIFGMSGYTYKFPAFAVNVWNLLLTQVFIQVAIQNAQTKYFAKSDTKQVGIPKILLLIAAILGLLMIGLAFYSQGKI